MNTKNTTLLIIFVWALLGQSFAQLSHGGIPYSLTNKMEVPEVLMTDNSELYYIDSAYQKDCSALEFGRFLELNSKLGDENWTISELEEGDKLYRLAVKSEGALAVGAYFKDFYLPKGAELFIYSPLSHKYKGSFNHLNNANDRLFATEFLLGDELVVEYYEPKEVAGQGSLVVSDILHAYRGVNEYGVSKDFGDSGDCEINVNCVEGSGKENQRDGVLRLLIKNGSSSVWCTGSLINNTRQDGTPYVLTADHCGKYADDDDLALWLFYFNYQSKGCVNPDFEPIEYSLRGCEKLAASVNANMLGSDFYLVKISKDIPSEYAVYFNGWNRASKYASDGYSIHHPQGDIKKISTYTIPLESASYSSGIDQGYWKVYWAETATGQGVTEGGSSGSPIFDKNGLIVGTLTGGGASCASPNSPDYYGKFSVHWDGNGSQEDQQLKPWLDPDNTGQTSLTGLTLGLEDIAKDDNALFSLQPNPAKDYVEVVFEDNNNGGELQILQLNGKVIHSYVLSESGYVNIGLLPSGIYLVKLITADKIAVEKLIKY